jgi:hypothetical protein
VSVAVATTPAAVRQALAVKLTTLPGLKTAYAYEPEQLGELPVTTLLLAFIQPREIETGPRLDVTWSWQLRIYVNLSDWEAAQTQLEELAYASLSLWRDDPTLGDLLEWWTIADTGEPPVFSAPDRWLRKALLVQARIENVP